MIDDDKQTWEKVRLSLIWEHEHDVGRGLTLNDISRDRGRGELGRGWSRGRGPLGLSTDIRWRQSQEHQAPVFSDTSPDNCWLHKNVKTAETVAAWLHETGYAQSICPRVTMDKHCTGHWHSSVRTQESLHFTAPLFMVTSSSSQVLMVSWCLTSCLHYISWSQLLDRCARSESLSHPELNCAEHEQMRPERRPPSD